MAAIRSISGVMSDIDGFTAMVAGAALCAASWWIVGLPLFLAGLLLALKVLR